MFQKIKDWLTGRPSNEEITRLINKFIDNAHSIEESHKLIEWERKGWIPAGTLDEAEEERKKRKAAREPAKKQADDHSTSGCATTYDNSVYHPPYLHSSSLPEDDVTKSGPVEGVVWRPGRVDIPGVPKNVPEAFKVEEAPAPREVHKPEPEVAPPPREVTNNEIEVRGYESHGVSDTPAYSPPPPPSYSPPPPSSDYSSGSSYDSGSSSSCDSGSSSSSSD